MIKIIYVGSKNRLSKELVPIIQSYILDTTTQYIEPFVGGANVIDKIQFDNKIGYDIDKYVISCLSALRDGWNPPKIVTKEEYIKIKSNLSMYPDYLVGYIGYELSFGAKWFGGYAGIVHTKIGTERNYYNEAVRNVLNQVPKIKDVYYECLSYENIEIKNLKNCMIYLDPPYEGTTKYKDDFDYIYFWDWVRELSKDNYVLISEYNSPEDFNCIWNKELTTTLDKNSRSKSIEKLFAYKDGLYTKYST